MVTHEPDKRCDLVMKGGLTSGAAYPPAIMRLKDEYCFGKVGGASAGAIAAAATAAAELGRRRDGFAQLDALAKELTDEPGRLLSLFQPSRATRPAFRLLVRLLQHRPNARRERGLGRVLTALWAVTRYLWWWPLLGAAAATLVLWAAAPDGVPQRVSWPQAVAFVVAVAVGAAAGLGLGVTVRARRLVTRHLPANFYGMCSGMTVKGSGRDALTPWLYAHLQAMAGKSPGEPLTFADLGRATLPVDDDGSGVRLQMMTTDLTLSRPVVLPIEDDQRYFFSESEFARLFPAEVASYLTRDDVSRRWQDVVDDERSPGDHDLPDDLRTLPSDQLPIIVATRMSLSFPVLLSAIPLYTHRARGPRRWMRHWLSDGGIGSNFPIHFFDSWLPRYPTFALSFIPQRSAGDPGPSLRDRVGVGPWTWQRRGAIDSLPAFLSAIVDTMQNWRDTLQAELPGFRDRIAEIELAAGEGGMNLAMSTDAIENLQEKGGSAADQLKRHFSWPTHRFQRYEMTMRLLDTNLGDEAGLGRGYRHDEFDDDISSSLTSIANDLRRLGLDDLADDLEARKTTRWCTWARRQTDDLLGVAASWHNGDPDLTFSGEPVPKPTSELRVIPPV